jgi:hypothetical protein
MSKECPNKGKAFISKSTFSNTKECEHYGVEGHDIGHCYSWHLKLCPDKSINKDGNIAMWGRYNFQFKGKTTCKTFDKANDKGEVVA